MSLDGIAHRGQIHNGRHAGKVLHQHARRHVGDLAAGLSLRIPLGQELNIAGGDGHSVFAPQQVLKQYLQAEWKAAQVKALGGESRQAINRIRLLCRI